MLLKNSLNNRNVKVVKILLKTGAVDIANDA